MKNIDTLFVCKANVGRSQIAEGFYNKYSRYGEAISCAGVEARKEKYNGKPSTEVINLMNKKGIDISKQEINYIENFTNEVLLKLNKIIFLYNPKNNNKIDNECKIKEFSPYEYIRLKFNGDLFIYDIEDPFGKSNNSVKNIINQIENIVKNLNK